jgi:hypothetical protein
MVDFVQVLRRHLLRHKIATLSELKVALGTTANLTVFRMIYQRPDGSSSTSPRSGSPPSISRSSFAHSEGRSSIGLEDLSLFYFLLEFLVDWTHNFSLSPLQAT